MTGIDTSSQNLSGLDRGCAAGWSLTWNPPRVSVCWAAADRAIIGTARESSGI